MPLQRCRSKGRSGWKWGESGKCYVGKDAKQKARRQAAAIKASGFTENQRTKVAPSNPLKADPTRTLTLRRAFAAEVARRFRWLARRINDLLIEEDAFGLKRESRRLAVNTRWADRPTPDQVEAFRVWLQQQINEGIIAATTGLDDDTYWQRFIEEGYQKGSHRAFMDSQAVRLAAGENLNFFEGTRAQFLAQSFAHPETVEKIKLLAGGFHNGLSGVSMSTHANIVRVLAEGLSQGRNPRDIGAAINRATGIGSNRAQVIAQDEIIRAHAEGQLDSLERLGVTEVGVAAEYSTAGDNRVCQKCRPLEGMVLKVSEAHGMIPRHPRCRCTFIPANVGESHQGQKRSTKSLQEAIRRSVRAEIPKGSKRSLKAQTRLSRWPGARKSISKKRPKSVV